MAVPACVAFLDGCSAHGVLGAGVLGLLCAGCLAGVGLPLWGVWEQLLSQRRAPEASEPPRALFPSSGAPFATTFLLSSVFPQKPCQDTAALSNQCTSFLSFYAELFRYEVFPEDSRYLSAVYSTDLRSPRPGSPAPRGLGLPAFTTWDPHRRWGLCGTLRLQALPPSPTLTHLAHTQLRPHCGPAHPCV